MRWILRIGLFEMLITPFAQAPADENRAIDAFRPQLRHVDAARTRGGEIVFSRRNRGVGRCDDEDEDDDQSMLFTQKRREERRAKSESDLLLPLLTNMKDII